MSDMVDRINAQLDEWEAAADADFPTDDDLDPDLWLDAADAHKSQPHSANCGWRLGEGLSKECECDYPAAVLTIMAGLRAVVALHMPDVSLDWLAERTYITPECGACGTGTEGEYPGHGDFDPVPWPCPTIRAIAAIWPDTDPRQAP